jgi:hypothetical protein
LSQKKSKEDVGSSSFLPSDGDGDYSKTAVVGGPSHSLSSQENGEDEKEKK